MIIRPDTARMNGPQTKLFIANNPTVDRSQCGGISSEYAHVKYAGVFNGITDYLTVNSSDFAVGTGDFCIEGYASYPTVLGSERAIFQLSAAPMDGVISFALAYHQTGYFRLNYGATSAQYTMAVPSGLFHWAVSRSSGTVRVYINKTKIIEVSDTENITYQYLTVGGWWSTSYLWAGYIGNMRFSNVSRGYTGTTITPPPTAYVYDADTKLLLRTDQPGASFSDTCPTQKAVVKVGTPVITNKKITNVGGVTIADASGTLSGKKVLNLNGTTQYLTVGPSADWDMSKDYTVDFWALVTTIAPSIQVVIGYAVGASGILLGREASSTGNYWGFWGSSNNSSWDLGQGVNFSASHLVDVNIWQHIALVKSGMTLMLFKNGIKASSNITLSANPTNPTAGYWVGAYVGGGNWPGQLADVRFTRFARWTKNFIPPNGNY